MLPQHPTIILLVSGHDKCADGLVSLAWIMVHAAVFSLQHGPYYRLTTSNLQPTANQERNDQCRIQHYSRELLMMGIVVPETC